MSSSPLNLRDMPPELSRLIAERADTKSRCVLRKCSKDFRKLVDDSKAICQVMRVALTDSEQITVVLDNNCQITYKQSEEGCEVLRHSFGGRELQHHGLLPGDNYLATAIETLMTILRNRRLIVKNLSIRSYLGFDSQLTGQFIRAFQENLSTLNHQLHVEKCKLWRFSEDEMMQILPFYQPGTLKIVKVSLKSVDRGQLSQIVNLEQWKRAEELVSTVVEPLDEILHFKKIRLYRQFDEIRFYNIEWTELKSFIEKVIAQSDTSPLEFCGHLLEEPFELSVFLFDFPSTPASRPGERRSILKVHNDGSKVVLVRRFGYLGIHNYATDQDTSF